MSETAPQRSSGAVHPSRSPSKLTLSLIPVAFLFAASVLWYDAKLKASPAAGYAPADADWSIAVEDVGRTWSRLYSSDVYARITAESGDFFEQPVLDLRMITGIRFTPARWNLWCGRTALVSKKDGVRGVCLRPGLLFRLALLFRGSSSDQRDGLRIYRLGGMAYAWKDGYVILSDSEEFVRAAAGGELYEKFGDDAPVEIRGTSPNASAWLLRCTPWADVPVSGWIEASITGATRPLLLVEGWDVPPIVTVSGTLLEDLQHLVGGLGFATKETQKFSEFLDRWLPQDEDQYEVVLAGLDATEVLIVPETLLVLRGTRDAGFKDKYAEAIPYEWNGLPGWVYPIAGEKMSLVVMRTEDGHFIATQEGLLARYAATLRSTRSVDGDIAVTLDWARAAEGGTALLERAAEYELLPLAAAHDVRETMQGALDAVSQLGTLSLIGVSREGKVEFQGHLARWDGSGATEAAKDKVRR